jgi:hypothetical protein
MQTVNYVAKVANLFLFLWFVQVRVDIFSILLLCFDNNPREKRDLK